jgi:hypothetical protein
MLLDVGARDGCDVLLDVGAIDGCHVLLDVGAVDGWNDCGEVTGKSESSSKTRTNTRFCKNMKSRGSRDF